MREYAFNIPVNGCILCDVKLRVNNGPWINSCNGILRARGTAAATMVPAKDCLDQEVQPGDVVEMHVAAYPAAESGCAKGGYDGIYEATYEDYSMEYTQEHFECA